jgi:hypothetical protein
MSRVHIKTYLFLMLTMVLSAGAVFGQTSGFTYQGRLTDGGIPANGNYDLQFALFDAADGNNQIGQTKIVSSVPVSGGVFTVTLDFGASAFSGANRFLEISARPNGAGAFALLTPRQPITSTPYAVRSSSTASADNAQQLGGVDAGQYVKTNDARMSDARDPKAGNSNYVQNSTSQQAATNFNISGNGTAGGSLSGNTVNAATQYNLAGQKVLELSGNNLLKFGNNTHVGIGPSFDSSYQLDVEAPGLFGLRVGTVTPGGTALSIGGFGDLKVDAPGNPGGRFLIKENGNVGIGTTGPTSKLTVGGMVESAIDGFKFPDGSVQATAAGKVFTNGPDPGEVEVSQFPNTTTLNTLNLPPGTYVIMATVNFQNRADNLFADHTRMVKCQLINEFIWFTRLGAPANPADWVTMNLHTVRVQSGNGSVSLSCGVIDGGQVFAKARRLTAIRVADSPSVQ